MLYWSYLSFWPRYGARPLYTALSMLIRCCSAHYRTDRDPGQIGTGGGRAPRGGGDSPPPPMTSVTMLRSHKQVYRKCLIHFWPGQNWDHGGKDRFLPKIGTLLSENRTISRAILTRANQKSTHSPFFLSLDRTPRYSLKTARALPGDLQGKLWNYLCAFYNKRLN